MSNAMTLPKTDAKLAKTSAPADMSVIERVMIEGDLKALTPEQRVAFYNRTCESLGLNPMTAPFSYLTLNGKLTLYARRDATDQLRRRYGISIRIVNRERMGDVYVVTAQASTPDGRVDESTGAIPLGESIKGENLANALMKAETKAKRRVTLSICGLGMVDESEISSIKGARVVNVTADGEIIDEMPAREYMREEQADETPASDPDAADRLGNAMADAKTKAELVAIGLEVGRAGLSADAKKGLVAIYKAAEKRIGAAAAESA